MVRLVRDKPHVSRQHLLTIKSTFDTSAFLRYVLLPIYLCVNDESEVVATTRGIDWRVVYMDR
jgi:hypothetical protein